jgi:hypothetical protein
MAVVTKNSHIIVGNDDEHSLAKPTELLKVMVNTH